MPRGVLHRELDRALAPLTTHLPLPLFFVYSGLNARLDLVDSWRLWGVFALALAAALGGKLVACALAARAHGAPWREAAALGTMMNARGLMELIPLNIGPERGIIRPALFSVLVMMAIVTTLMATPLFHRLHTPAHEAAHKPV